MSHPSFYRSKQKTAYSHVGSNTELDDNHEYVKNQSDLLQSQQQQSIGNIPSNIARVQHSDIIQSARYGISAQETLHGSNIYADKYHPYNPYYDWLYTKGLLKENFKTRINTTYINVDSSSRTISPKMITINDTKLGNNPLSYDNESIEVGIMTSTQHLLRISYPNHTLRKNDRITLTGLEKTTIQIKTIYSVNGITKTAVIFTPGSSSVIFVCNYDEDDTESPMSFNPNFKIGEEILHDTLRVHDMSDVLVSISGFDISSIGTPYIGNVPINFLNSTHVMYLTNPDYSIQNGEIVYSSDDIINKPNDNGYVTKITGFYIKLSTPFSGDVPERSSTLTLTFNHFGGYPINKLNAEFPIDKNHLIGYHQIYSVGVDYVTVAIEKNTYYENSNFGGDDIYISQVTSLKNGYTESNNYKIELPKMIHNVVIAKLISTAFPNTSKIFRNNKNDSNNKLYWQNHDDGDYVYNIEINPGNYSHTSLSRLIETKINSVPKRYAKGATTNTTYTNMNFMTVNIDDETDIVTFKSFNEVILTKPIQSISPEISDTNDGIPPYIVTILHVSHGLKEGDTVLFSGMISTMGIPESVLNSYHIIASVPTDDTYTILINNFNLSSESRINTNRIFRYHFDYYLIIRTLWEQH
jgi:hypothetical protein